MVQWHFERPQKREREHEHVFKCGLWNPFYTWNSTNIIDEWSQP